MHTSCAPVDFASQPAVQLRPRPNGGTLRSMSAGVAAPCVTCRVRSLCLPGAADGDEALPVDELVTTRKRVHDGEHVFRAGDPFDALYAVRSGFFKSDMVAADGRTQVTGFPMAGDCVGMDGIGAGTHTQNVVALETGEVCVVPYAHLQELCIRSAALYQQFNRLMGREIVREQQLMLLLGSMQAEAKVAEFLLSLSRRFAARGYSSTEFNLWMTRSEIGSYLGLKLETVSRILSRLHRLGAIRAKARHVTILDPAALHKLTLEERAPQALPGVAALPGDARRTTPRRELALAAA